MTTPRARLTQLLATCLPALALLQGCSFIFVDTPPARYAEAPRPVACTSSVAAPVVDTVIAAFETVRTGFAISADDTVYTNYPISRGADIGIGVGLTALFAASAIYGYVNTSQCSDLKEHPVSEPPPGMMPPPPRAAPLHALCSYDAQCKGDRICEGGRCVSPATPVTPPPEAAPPAAPELTPSAPPPDALPGSGPV